MARIRTIKPEFWVSEQVGECSTNARLLFIGIWNFCDDNGVHPAKPKTLKAEVFPMDDISAAEVQGWVDELVRAGLLIVFEAQGARYWHVTGWANHQRIDRPSAKHPAPPAKDSALPPLLLDEDSTNARRSPPPGVEGKGKEGKESASPSTPPAAIEIPELEKPNTAQEKKATRLPADWVPTDEDLQFCQENRPDLDPMVVADSFRDYWTSKSGKDATKRGWSATWRNWVRSEKAPRAPAFAAAGKAVVAQSFEGNI